MWLRQAGSAGEDKGMAVAVSDGSVYLGGMMSGDGGVDGLLSRYSTDGAPMWVKQLGTPASDEVWALAADPRGGVYLAGYTAGDFARTLNGDKAAAVAVDPSGNLYVAGFTDGSLETPLGKFDGVLIKYSPGHPRSWTRQFGTADVDAADAFAEANLYLAVTPRGRQLSGLSGTDVFRTAFTSDGSNTLPYNVWWAPRPRSGRASHGRTTT